MDKAREAIRLTDVAKQFANAAGEMEKRKQQQRQRAEQKKAAVPWSNKLSKKEEKERRREKKDRKKKWRRAQETQLKPIASSSKRSRSPDEPSDGEEDDWAELAKEERMAKKLKRGDISQHEFDREFGDL